MNKDDLTTLPSSLEDPVEKLKAVEKLLKGEANRVEVRGYELARLHPSGRWEQVIKYRDGEHGLGQAAKDASWLNARHPNTLYQARVLVSAEIPDRPEKK